MSLASTSAFALTYHLLLATIFIDVHPLRRSSSSTWLRQLQQISFDVSRLYIRFLDLNINLIRPSGTVNSRFGSVFTGHLDPIVMSSMVAWNLRVFAPGLPS
ncbi:hypothetical protein BDV95DRAFT_580801 [Massariosphaeria phaeospora]|uniref:Uncharacterized protein n=1 Tax=Massariosphaeria phaeospora TaxID=100035 RepID=A0A7C8MIE3_9PLEO|nr:hypothetical protein BDV95DRAFT_580801 [Massariosphaeria phaeospora]